MTAVAPDLILQKRQEYPFKGQQRTLALDPPAKAMEPAIAPQGTMTGHHYRQ
jgi:hypothetical protein